VAVGIPGDRSLSGARRTIPAGTPGRAPASRRSPCALQITAPTGVRKCKRLVREGGAFGLIATNTIAQGDTRDGGLSEIIRRGGVVYNGIRRLRWPNQAAVVVSVVHLGKGAVQVERQLDGKVVPRISVFLFPGGVDENPAKLARNPYFSAGSKIYGQGFVFSDDDPKATALTVKDQLLVT